MIQKANTIFSDYDIGIEVPQSGIAHEDLLVIHKLSQNLEKEKKRQTSKKIKDP